MINNRTYNRTSERDLPMALLLHTKDDSVEFPSDRVKLLREVIYALDNEIEQGKED